MPAARILSVACSSGPSPSKGYGGAGSDSEADGEDDQRPGMASALEKPGRLGGRCLGEAATGLRSCVGRGEISLPSLPRQG